MFGAPPGKTYGIRAAGLPPYGTRAPERLMQNKSSSRAAEPFDLGTLVPPGVRSVRLEIRLRKDSIRIRISAEDPAGGAAPAIAAGAVLWRAPGTPLLLSLPRDVAVLVDVDTEETAGSEPGL